MDRRTRNLFAVAMVAIVVLTGGAALVLGSGAPDPSATPPADADQVVGVVVAVDSRGLDDVRGFTLRREGGEQLAFSLAALANGTRFPPGHLAEHLADAVPIRVWFRGAGGERQAIWLEDALESTSGAPPPTAAQP